MQNRIHLNGKGKVERCFRTVKDKFFNCLDWNTIVDINQAQNMYSEFLNKEYINIDLQQCIEDIIRDIKREMQS